MLLLNLRGMSGPLYRRIYQALNAAIRAGRLGPSARLPSTRALAADLGVSRNTVMLAYEQLAAEGYLVSRDRSATSVAAAVPAPPLPSLTEATAGATRISAYAKRLTRNPANPPSGSYTSRPGLRYDFRYGKPAMDEFPRQIWRRMLAARARRSSTRNSPELYGYVSPAGHAPLRQALSDYLKRARGVACDAEQIVIVNGSQQGFDLAARVLLDPGDGAVIEEPHYPGSTLPFEAAGAQLIRVGVDGQGLDTARLPLRARLACVSPCHQFPTGVIMSMERRLALLDWAARTGAWVVEDDYISEFRYEGRPLEALQSLDRGGRVIYVGTFSKTLFPALRLAYLVLPRALVRPFLAAKWAADRFSATLAQAALAEFIASGHFERYLRRASGRNAARRRALIEALQQHFGERMEVAGEDAGVHLLVWLNGTVPRDVDALIAKAATAGVGLYSIAPYYTRPLRRPGLLFGYASLSEADIRAGVRKLAAVM
jgi:GntR family transcriptional regulator/MocR family aminotransferase